MELVRGQTYSSNHHLTLKPQCHLHGHSQTSVNKTPIKALDPETQVSFLVGEYVDIPEG